MVDSFIYLVTEYFSDLSYLLEQQWRHMTPTKYTIILLSIGLFGWILMRRGVREY